MKNKQELYIIFEGNSEKKFLEKLNKLYQSKYNIKPVDACGSDNIINKYKKI